LDYSHIQMLEKGGQSGSGDVILIITSGSSSANDVASALAVAQRKQVHISLVAFAYSQQLGSLRHLQTLSDATGGLMTSVASKGVGTMSHISMLIQLGDALIASLNHHQKMFSRNVPVLVSTPSLRGSFLPSIFIIY